MKSAFVNNSLISTILCGLVIVAMPEFAAGLDGGTGGGSAHRNTAEANSGASVSTGVSASGDISSPDASNNAASVDNSTQTSAGELTWKAKKTAGAADAGASSASNSRHARASTNRSAGASAH